MADTEQPIIIKRKKVVGRPHGGAEGRTPISSRR
jgi:hypothetical protein